MENDTAQLSIATKPAIVHPSVAILVVVVGLVSDGPTPHLPSPSRPRTLPPSSPQLPTRSDSPYTSNMSAAAPQHEPITAENVHILFPEINNTTTSVCNASELKGYDAEQVRLMDEVCIVLDNDDKPIGSASKKTCGNPYGLWNSLATNPAPRPPHDQHRARSPPPCLLSLPLRLAEAPSPPAARGREDHLRRSVPDPARGA